MDSGDFRTDNLNRALAEAERAVDLEMKRALSAELERDALQESLAAIWDMLEVGDQQHAEGYVSQAVRAVLDERDKLRAALAHLWGMYERHGENRHLEIDPAGFFARHGIDPAELTDEA
jgi:hypothetical protein